jgi:hypothetical protein
MKNRKNPDKALSRCEQKKLTGGQTYSEYNCVTEHCYYKCINVTANIAICHDCCLHSSTVAAARSAGCMGKQ